MTSPETVGQRLKRLRVAAGMSQRELARPGVSYAYISRIEADTRQPSAKAIRKLAPSLGVTAEYLEFGRDAPTVRIEATERRIDARAREWGGVPWRDLSPDERRAVVVGLEESLLDTLAARLYAVKVLRAEAAKARA